MNEREYIEAFHHARVEYEGLKEQQAAIERRLTQLQQFMVVAAQLLGENPPEPQIGFTDAVRQVIKSSGHHGLSPRQIEVNLAALGLELPENVRVTIHVALKRLIANNEIEAFRDADQAKKYRRTGKNTVIQVPAGSLTIGSEPLTLEDVQRSRAAEPEEPPAGIKRILGDSQARREKLLGKK